MERIYDHGIFYHVKKLDVRHIHLDQKLQMIPRLEFKLKVSFGLMNQIILESTKGNRIGRVVECQEVRDLLLYGL